VEAHRERSLPRARRGKVSAADGAVCQTIQKPARERAGHQRYPYFATRSEIVEKVLPNKEDRTRVEAARPAKQTPGLITLGYESKTLETYLNQLLKSGVTLLCDVRRNPLSRKYGFSKSTLSHACAGVGIRYEHLPESGEHQMNRD
jgi:hypothetical protein